MTITITINDSFFSPTRLRYMHNGEYAVFIKGESSVNLHPDVISACEEMEDDLGRIITRMKEHEDYIAPSRAKGVVNG